MDQVPNHGSKQELDQDGDRSQIAQPGKSFDLGMLAKVLTTLTAVAYGTGVVAINTYLHGLGITDFSFGKPKLLLTGKLVLGSFLFLASTPMFIAWSYCSSIHPKAAAEPRSREMLFVGLLALAALVFASIMICFRLETPLGRIQEWWVWEHLSKQSGLAKSWAVVLIVVAVFSPGCAAAFFGFKAKQYWTKVKPIETGSCIPLDYFHFAGSVFLAMACVVGFILIFTFVFYPSVPAEFGGGEPYFESFAIADDQVCQLQRIGIPFDPLRPGITKPLPILHETDTLVAVWLQGKPDLREKHKAAQQQAIEVPSGGMPAEAPATAGAITAEAEIDDPAHEKDASGLGEFQFIVVQLDESAIVATRAYPHWKKVPVLNRLPVSCNKEDAAGAAAAGH